MTPTESKIIMFQNKREMIGIKLLLNTKKHIYWNTLVLLNFKETSLNGTNLESIFHQLNSCFFFEDDEEERNLNVLGKFFMKMRKTKRKK